MKLLLSIILTALLAFALGMFLPWWTIAIAAFIVSILIYLPPGLSFFSGFSGVLLLWLVLSWFITTANNNILATKIAHVLPLGGSVLLLVLVTCFVGGLVGGLSALTGSLLRKIR